MNNVQELFAVPVLSVKLNLDTEAMMNYCDELHKKGGNRVVSNQGGFQSLMDMSIKSVQPLIEKIEYYATELAKNLINNNDQKIESMWLNVNGHKHFNLSHIHSGSDLSGIYYLKTPKDCGQLMFQHPASDLLTYYTQHQKRSSLNTWNSENWYFEPVKDWLYIFPSWLKHAVLMNNSRSDRVSVAFNCSEK